jgi:hypothetical protein
VAQLLVLHQRLEFRAYVFGLETDDRGAALGRVEAGLLEQRLQDRGEPARADVLGVPVDLGPQSRDLARAPRR